MEFNPGGLRTGPEHHLNLRLTGIEARGLLPIDHVYAEAQFALGGVAGEFAGSTDGREVSLQQADDALVISGDDFAASIGRQSGLLSSVSWSGQELLLTPLTPNFWRAPTDNDFGNYMQDWAAVWERAGRNRSLTSLEAIEDTDDRIVVIANYEFSDDDGNRVATWHSRYTFHPSGAIDFDNALERADGLPVMPRVGMNVEVIRQLDQVEWFGRGVFENYSDRNTAANVGRYSNTVAEHYVPYMRPQENGYKTDVRWISLSDNETAGLLVTTDALFGFGVHHNRLADFVPPVKIAITSEDGPGARDNEERVNMHVNDIVPRDIVSLDIDYGQMGVGGDDSWGKRTLQKYSLNEKQYQYRFTLQPYSPESGRLDQLVSRQRP